MTGISLHMQWPLTSQSHGSVSQREQSVFSLWIKLHSQGMDKVWCSGNGLRKKTKFQLSDLELTSGGVDKVKKNIEFDEADKTDERADLDKVRT
jgi:hypothetical protein